MKNYARFLKIPFMVSRERLFSSSFRNFSLKKINSSEKGCPCRNTICHNRKCLLWISFRVQTLFIRSTSNILIYCVLQTNNISTFYSEVDHRPALKKKKIYRCWLFSRFNMLHRLGIVHRHFMLPLSWNLQSYLMERYFRDLRYIFFNAAHNHSIKVTFCVSSLNQYWSSLYKCSCKKTTYRFRCCLKVNDHSSSS